MDSSSLKRLNRSAVLIPLVFQERDRHSEARKREEEFKQILRTGNRKARRHAVKALGKGRIRFWPLFAQVCQNSPTVNPPQRKTHSEIRAEKRADARREEACPTDACSP